MVRIAQILVDTIPLRADISNAAINFAGLTGSIVAIVAEEEGQGERVGFGFGSIGRYAHSEMIRDRFSRRLLDAKANEYCDDGGGLDPVKMGSVMRRDEKPGGHGERPAAIGAIDMAAWDLVGKLENRPLYQVLSDRFSNGLVDEDVAVYAAGGYYYETGGLERLKRELEEYLKTGYTSVKIKIGAGNVGDDVSRIQTAIDCVGSSSLVAVDANGRFDSQTAVAVAREIESFGLRWFEEVGDPLDYELQNWVAKHYQGAMATGENLFSVQDVRNLLRYGGMRSDRDVLQMDPGLSYGVSEYVGMLGVLEDFNWSRRRCFPHGGNLFNLHVACGLQLGGTEAYPGVFEPFGGFGEEVEIQAGRATPPLSPGIGWETKPELMDLFQGLLNGR